MEIVGKQILNPTEQHKIINTYTATNNNSSGDGFLPKDQRIQSSSTCQIIGKNIKNLLANLKYQIIISILTIYSLFFDDFRTAVCQANMDIYFDYVGIIIITIFTIQIILSSIFIEDYFLSFFFFLDIISTLSMIFDINFISTIIFSTGNSSSLTQLAAQSKASRAATRAVRIVKLVRIIRIIKLYKNAEKAKQIKQKSKKKQLLRQKLLKKKKLNDTNTKDPSSYAQQSQSIMIQQPKKIQSQQVYPQENIKVDEQAEQRDIDRNQQTEIDIKDDDVQNAMKKQSKIGKILSDKSIKKIIIVILLLMFIIPLFNIDVYRDPQNVWDYSLKNQNQLLLMSSTDLPTSSIINLINTRITNFEQQANFIIQYTSPFNELPYYNKVDLTTIRSSDLISSVQSIDVNQIMAARSDLTLRSDLTAKQAASLTVILNQSSYNTIIAVFSICKTLFVCFILIVLMQLFSNDINTLLVEPIEGMMQKLMLMAKDPESAAKQDLNTNTQLQTTVISNAIIKIGALLSIVFGSAGAEIIGSNIIQQGDMNPMIEGKKKAAIFGFCDIRHFTEVTEVLQEQILIFVNKIGSLVHQSVYRYGGCANKNIGQAFLLVWKIPQDKYTLDYQTNAIQWKDRRYLSILADFSVFGFVKTLIKIHKDPLVLEYGLDNRLRQKIPDFSVSMGFGLHVGWAIQGAIGSEYKIDASYLSPNVNMASRLEAATKQFGVDFLISEDLYDLLTNQMKSYFRNIDRVTVKGSQKPLKLYTIDLNYDRITPPARKDLKYPNIADMPDAESKQALNMEYLKGDEIENYNAKKFIMGKKQLKQVLFQNLPQDFKKRFDLGVNCYLKGKWGDSRLHLCEALKHKVSDGPSKTLLNYMKKFNYIAPSNWKQYRPLTSK